MGTLGVSVKNLFSVKIKTRYDSYTDQVSRIVVVKLFLAASIIMGIDWFHDNLACIPPPSEMNNILPEKFIESACWVRGFFIYPDLANHMSSSGYYGIPSDLRNMGLRSTSFETVVCPLTDKKSSTCAEMNKYYFAQYQWMPFYIASLAAMMYLPYIFFRLVNTDIISLRLNMNDEKVTCDQIVDIYFNHDINSRFKLRMRIVMNLCIKISYVFVNVFAFVTCDFVLNSKFLTYGMDWVKWSQQNSSMAYDFYKRSEPTPGNRMFPTFGMCDLVNSRRGLIKTVADKVTVVCEISTNVLYQYVFLVLWFVLICSIAISCLGVVIYLGSHFHIAFFIRNDRSSKSVYKKMTYRECEYLEFIRCRDLVMYDVIVRRLCVINLLPLPKMSFKMKIQNGSEYMANANAHPHPLRHLDSFGGNVNPHPVKHLDSVGGNAHPHPLKHLDSLGGIA